MAKPTAEFLSKMSAPARRALEKAKITTLGKLALKTEEDIAALHGVGPAAIATLRAELKKAGLKFRKS